jgi:hypothetical protein
MRAASTNARVDNASGAKTMTTSFYRLRIEGSLLRGLSTKRAKRDEKRNGSVDCRESKPGAGEEAL